MYDQGTQVMGQRRSVRYSVGRSRQRRGPYSQEQVRLTQLIICLALFFAIFLGKGMFPQKMNQVRENILALIATDLDFQQTLANLGEALSKGDSVLSDFGTFCVEVFGPGAQENNPSQTGEISYVSPKPAGVLTSELEFLSQHAAAAARTVHYADFSRLGVELTEETPVQEETEPVEEDVVPEPPAVQAAGTVITISDYSGDPLPNNYTMDQLSLGEIETIVPVLGRLNSEYGYRDHPINGKYLFHGGVDIGGQQGDPIAAFSDGTVEYTGEDDSYGLYLQLDHGNGVKSFYAHCSKIVVTKGQTVTMGEKVAEIGSTGNSTGPHLHLELKYQKMHLNPAYYVEFLEQ